jgi:hypothetical protein
LTGRPIRGINACSMMMRPSGSRVAITCRFDDRRPRRGSGSRKTPSRTLAASRRRLGYSVHTARPRHSADYRSRHGHGKGFSSSERRLAIVKSETVIRVPPTRLSESISSATPVVLGGRIPDDILFVVRASRMGGRRQNPVRPPAPLERSRHAMQSSESTRWRAVKK